MAALFVHPNDFFTVASNTRALGTSICVLLFIILQLFIASKKVNFYWMDVWWIILIVYTGLSSLWSLNSGYAIYGMFTTALMYLCFKVFESVDWAEKAIVTSGYWIAFICLIIGLSIEFYAVREVIFSGFSFGKNAHLFGSLILVLLPFVIFNKMPISKVLSPILLIISIVIVFVSESAQVAILLTFLTIVYVFYRLKSIKNKKYLIVVLSLVGIIGSTFFLKSSKGLKKNPTSFIINEFYSQNDRLLLWKNSWKLFSESPIIGHGKNNWELAVSKYGYDDYIINKPRYLKPYRFKHSHNSFFQIISETGLIGLGIYTAIIYLLFSNVFKNKRELTLLQLSSLMSLLLFFLLTNTYGITFNFFDNFRGISTIAIIAFSILFNGKIEKPLFSDYSNLSGKIMHGVCMLTALTSFIFFFCVKQARNDYDSSRVLIRHKKNEKAEFYLKSAINFYPLSNVYLELGKLHKRNNQLVAANTIYNKALKRDPFNLQLLYHQALILYQQKKYEEALSYSKNGYDLSESFLQNKILYAQCMFKINEEKKAKLLLKNILETIEKKRTNYNLYRNEEGDFINKKAKSRNRTLNNIQKELDIFLNNNNVQL